MRIAETTLSLSPADLQFRHVADVEFRQTATGRSTILPATTFMLDDDIVPVASDSIADAISGAKALLAADPNGSVALLQIASGARFVARLLLPSSESMPIKAPDGWTVTVRTTDPSLLAVFDQTSWVDLRNATAGIPAPLPTS